MWPDWRERGETAQAGARPVTDARPRRASEAAVMALASPLREVGATGEFRVAQGHDLTQGFFCFFCFFFYRILLAAE